MSKITHHVYWNIKRVKKKIGKLEILTYIYIYIYIYAQLSYFKIPQVNMYIFNWKRARTQLKHTHAQLKAGICTTEACICWYVGVKRAYAQLVACTCSQLLLYQKCTIFSLENTAGHTGDLLISKMKLSNFSMKHSKNFVLKWYLLHAGKCKGQNVWSCTTNGQTFSLEVLAG